jgi:hypothetical protein
VSGGKVASRTGAVSPSTSGRPIAKPSPGRHPRGSISRATRLYGEIDVDVLSPEQYRGSSVGSADHSDVERARELLADAERR